MVDDRPFHFKHFSLYHHRSTMKVGTDAVLLGCWTKVKQTDIVLDIGTGCGILPLMLAQKGVAAIDAVDLDAESIEEARTNFEASQWRETIRAYHSDIRTFDANRKYDLIVSNPPYFINSFKCDAERRNQARHTDNSLTYNDLIDVSKRLLKADGRFNVVLPELESRSFKEIAADAGLFVSREMRVIPVEGKEPNRVNLEFRFQMTEDVEVSEFVIRNADNALSEEYKTFLKDYYLGL